MTYKVIPVDRFKKEAKRLIKKYSSLKSELADLSISLSQNPALGTPYYALKKPGSSSRANWQFDSHSSKLI